MARRYFSEHGGLPAQSEMTGGRAVFTEAYAVIPRGVLRDIVASRYPNWERARAWVLARPMSGFAETFAQYLMEVEPGGGSWAPEPDPAAEAALFCLAGEVVLEYSGSMASLRPGGFAYFPPGIGWRLRNVGAEAASFHWIRRAYVPAEGLDVPDPVLTQEDDIEPQPMPDTGGAWATTRFVDPADLRHDMAVTIVTLQPGAVIPFTETHVMEHGLYVLQGKGIYRLNRDWVEVEAGDFIWLRAFCPQGCYASGAEPFRYLLYKDVNRHPPLRIGGASL